MPKDLIEYKKRSIQNGKNARKYGGLVFLLTTVIVSILDRDVLPMIIPIMLFFYLVSLVLISIGLYFEENQLEQLIKEKNNNTKKDKEYYKQ